MWRQSTPLFSPSCLLEKPFSGSANCVFVSLSPAQEIYVPARRECDPYQHVLSSCASHYNNVFQFIADRHECPRLTWTERNPSSSLVDPKIQFILLPGSPSSFSELFFIGRDIGNNCNVNSCHCLVGTVLECNNSCTHLRHLLQHWRQLTCDRIKPYNYPVSSSSFYNSVPSGAWHRESLTQKAIYSKCWGCRRKRKLKVKQKTKTPAGGNATANIRQEGKLLSPNISAGNEIRSSWSLISHWQEQTGIQMSWREKQGFMKYFWQVWKNKSHSIWQM